MRATDCGRQLRTLPTACGRSRRGRLTLGAGSSLHGGNRGSSLSCGNRSKASAHLESDLQFISIRDCDIVEDCTLYDIKIADYGLSKYNDEAGRSAFREKDGARLLQDSRGR